MSSAVNLPRFLLSRPATPRFRRTELKIALTMTPTAAAHRMPMPCIANTAPTNAPRLNWAAQSRVSRPDTPTPAARTLLEYSDMITDDSG